MLQKLHQIKVNTQGQDLYNKQQTQAWASLAWLPGVLDKPLNEGKGWETIDNCPVCNSDEKSFELKKFEIEMNMFSKTYAFLKRIITLFGKAHAFIKRL